MLTNQSNCETCEHKKTPQGGWCYMFEVEPVKTCLHHTQPTQNTANTKRVYGSFSNKVLNLLVKS
jgi:hypothetical protein